MSRMVAYALAWTVAGMLGSATAAACTVAAPPPGQKPEKPTLRHVDTAIYGKVIRISERSPTFYRATVRVRRVYKGSVAGKIRIRYTSQAGACGTVFRDGAVVGLLLERPRPFYVDTFSRVSRRYLNRATDGEWHRPQKRRRRLS